MKRHKVLDCSFRIISFCCSINLQLVYRCLTSNTLLQFLNVPYVVLLTLYITVNLGVRPI
jgi:hypothetical protein